MPNLFCLVKDLHVGYTFHPDRGTLYLTSHAQDAEELFINNKSSIFSSWYTDEIIKNL